MHGRLFPWPAEVEEGDELVGGRGLGRMCDLPQHPKEGLVDGLTPAGQFSVGVGHAMDGVVLADGRS